ncbi:MAG: hypothetical protein QM756_27290 [Polyangiaceae bacterium]
MIGLSDRADALLLDASLSVLARYPGWFPWAHAGCVAYVANGVGERRLTCSPKPGRAAGAPLDALAGTRLTRRDGSVVELFAARRPSGEAWLELGEQRVALEGSVGAQLALGDLNGDGDAELMTTQDTLEPGADFLLVRTLDGAGKLREAFRLPVPAGVRALGVCPSSGDLLAPLLLSTGDELWVLK